MLNVLFTITNLFANVKKALKGILSRGVLKNVKIYLLLNSLYCYTVVNLRNSDLLICFYNLTAISDIPSLPCHPSPCGLNAICTERSGAGSCTCPPEFVGDPYVSCRPECVQNSDCPHSKACINNKCKNPCTGACGLNAECQVFNHQPTCSCVTGYTGDPLNSCHIPIISEFR